MVMHCGNGNLGVLVVVVVGAPAAALMVLPLAGERGCCGFAVGAAGFVAANGPGSSPMALACAKACCWQPESQQNSSCG